MSMTAITVSILLVATFMSHGTVYGGDVGINYGRLGNNLPPPSRVIEFLTKDLNHRIPLVRLFDPDPEALSALAATNLIVTLGVRNEDLSPIASNIENARNWVRQFVLPYNGLRLRYIAVGNEVIPGDLAVFVLPAMRNIRAALFEVNLQSILVSTAVSTFALGQSYPPSSGAFNPLAANILNDIANFLYASGAPLLVNLYPYFAYISDPQHVSLDYALFKSTVPIVNDGGRLYYNLFDAMVDAFVAAMARAVGKEDVKIVVSESGWPSAGHPAATIENAQTYNNNLKQHVQTARGTPRRPDLNLETYIFALFNENQKPPGTEQNFGSFYPDLREVYPLWR